jgi:integrase/recombinase XerD
MKPFESFLASQLNAYLAYRESLGYTCLPSRAHLLIFDRYLRQTGADWNSLQPAFFLEMRARLTMESRSVNRVLSSARVFFYFLVRRGEMAHNPLRDIPPLKENTIVPFVFSPEQVDRLLELVCKGIRKNKGCFLTDLAIYLTILLLARCGMRISEPISLLRDNYRREGATIYIEKTKFRKDRLIPVPQEIITQIENYLSVRKTLRRNDDNPYLLAGRRHKPLSDSIVRSVFRNAVREIGLDQPRRILGNVNFSQPTPHSLRHSFAVTTLKSVKERGESAQNALPVLAAYLGHSDYKHTSVYLRVADAATRENLVDFALWQKRKE